MPPPGIKLIIRSVDTVKFARATRRYQPDFLRDVDKAGLKAAEPLLAATKKATPVDTGALKRSTVIDKTGVYTGKGLDYAGYVMGRTYYLKSVIAKDIPRFHESYQKGMQEAWDEYKRKVIRSVRGGI